MTFRLHRAAALLAAGVVLLGACSDDDDDAADTTAVAAPDTTAGADTTIEATVATTAPPDTQAPPPSGGGDMLAAVQEADAVRCGTRDALPGFAVLDESGEHVGFDADFCRVVAAAVLGDATKVEFVDLETADRFTALQSGAIDVLIRNTTWTATRDG